MNNNDKSNTAYQVGGAIRPGNPFYIRRQADEELYNSLKAGDFCYVLNARQMGKSSLLVQTKSKLEQEGFACIAIDLAIDIGSQLDNQNQWYNSFIDVISDRLNLDSQISIWQAEKESLSHQCHQQHKTIPLSSI